jgi:hypothetical protein
MLAPHVLDVIGEKIFKAAGGLNRHGRDGWLSPTPFGLCLYALYNITIRELVKITV